MAVTGSVALPRVGATARLVRAILSSGFDPTLSDQLVADRPARIAAEHPPRPLGSGTASLDLGLPGLGIVAHSGHAIAWYARLG